MGIERVADGIGRIGGVITGIAGGNGLWPAIADVAAAHPGRPAMIHRETARGSAVQVIDYRQLIRSVGAAAGALRNAGVGEADGVAIIGASLPEYLMAFLAASEVGVAFPVNPLLSAEAIANQLELARVRICIVVGDPHIAGLGVRLAQAIDVASGVERLVMTHPACVVPGGRRMACLGWDAFLESRPSQPLPHRDGESICALFHTGGTSGSPKLAQLSRRALFHGPSFAGRVLGWRPDDRVLNLLPYFHVGGALSTAASVLLGGAANVTCGVLGARDPDLIEHFWQVAAELDISVAGLVPTSWGGVAERPIGPAPDRFRAMVTGGAAMPLPVRQRLAEALGLPFCEVYGMTEFAGFCAAQPLDGRFPTAGVGLSVPEIDIDAGDMPGEVRLYGPNVFSGYRSRDGTVGDPAGTHVRTGDLGRFGADGQLILAGRAKDVIVRSGHNIDPLSIEETASAHPGVVHAAAVGRPDVYAGEVPVLYVVAAPGTAAEDIDVYLRDHIAEPPARPRMVTIVDALPLTPVGKLDRNRLRQRAAVEAAGDALAGHEPAEIECTDVAARQLSIRWKRDPSAGQLAAIDAMLATLGLSCAA